MAIMFSSGIISGSTKRSINFILRKTSDNTEQTGKVASDMAAYYLRQGGSPVAISLSDLSAIGDAWSSGGVIEEDATHLKGTYRLDLPDAAIASGADWVEVAVTVTGCYVFHERFPLTSPANGTVWYTR